MDGVALSSCASPVDVSGLDSGFHNFTLLPHSPIVDMAAITWTWTVVRSFIEVNAFRVEANGSRTAVGADLVVNRKTLPLAEMTEGGFSAGVELEVELPLPPLDDEVVTVTCDLQCDSAPCSLELVPQRVVLTAATAATPPPMILQAQRDWDVDVLPGHGGFTILCAATSTTSSGGPGVFSNARVRSFDGRVSSTVFPTFGELYIADDRGEWHSSMMYGVNLCMCEGVLPLLRVSKTACSPPVPRHDVDVSLIGPRM
jgi:hypothetical protein